MKKNLAHSAMAYLTIRTEGSSFYNKTENKPILQVYLLFKFSSHRLAKNNTKIISSPCT